MLFTVDPNEAVTQDANRSNNQGTFTLFVGRLPTAAISSTSPKLTFETIVVDASMSVDSDGGDLLCLFDVELENGTVESSVAENCMIEKSWEDDGEYVVNLTIVDDENDVNRTSVLVIVNNRPAVVNLGFSASSCLLYTSPSPRDRG